MNNTKLQIKSYITYVIHKDQINNSICCRILDTVWCCLMLLSIKWRVIFNLSITKYYINFRFKVSNIDDLIFSAQSTINNFPLKVSLGKELFCIIFTLNFFALNVITRWIVYVFMPAKFDLWESDILDFRFFNDQCACSNKHTYPLGILS